MKNDSVVADNKIRIPSFSEIVSLDKHLQLASNAPNNIFSFTLPSRSSYGLSKNAKSPLPVSGLSTDHIKNSCSSKQSSITPSVNNTNLSSSSKSLTRKFIRGTEKKLMV